MPQLNPSPYFMTLVLCWTALLIIVVPKTLAFTHNTPPSQQTTHTPAVLAWTWPWS